MRWSQLLPGRKRPSRGRRRIFDDLGYTLFSVTGRLLSNANGKEHTQKLSDSVYLFSVYLWPLYTLAFLLLPIRNTELFTSDLDLTPSKVLEITHRLSAHYKTFNGRCEVRFLGTTTFFDSFSWSTEGFRALTNVLADVGVNHVALHTGKFQPDMRGLRLQLVNAVEVL